MKTSLRTLFLTFVFTMLCTAMAFAYNPGQRTIHLLGETLNSDKHPVHLVVTQTIDMREVLTAEAYAKLPTAQQKRTNRTEYNEANGINAERITTTDGDGKVIKDTVSFVKNGYWYTIDYLNKNYDRVPELPGMSMPFAETLISWFNVKLIQDALCRKQVTNRFLAVRMKRSSCFAPYCRVLIKSQRGSV